MNNLTNQILRNQYFWIGWIALGARLIHCLDWCKTPYFKIPLIDAMDHVKQARFIADGHLLWHGAFYGSPLYPYLLGGLYAIFGKTSYPVIGLQIVFGVCSCLILAKVTSKYFDSRTGLIAGLISALYGPFIFFTPILLKETLMIMSLAWLVLFLSRADLDGKKRFYFLTGLGLGLTALTRGNVLLIAPIILFYLLRKQLNWFSKTAIFILGIMIPVIPFTVHNWIVSKDLVLINYSGGFNFYLGNYEKANGVDVTPEGVSSDPAREYADTTRIAEEAMKGPVSPSQVSAYWATKAFAWISRHPLAWIKLEARKFAISLNNYEEPDNYDQKFYFAHFGGAFTQAFLSFSLIFAFSCLGLICMSKEEIWNTPFVFLLGSYLATLMIFYVNDRFRIPIAYFSIPLASLGLVRFYELLVKNPRQAFVPALVFSAAFLLSFVPTFHVEAENDATSWGHLAEIYRDTGQFENALTSYEKAIQASPRATDSGAIIAGAQALEKMSRIAEAQSVYENGLNIWPNDSRLLNAFGVYLLRRGLATQGVQELKKAISQDPTFADPYKNLFLFYSRENDFAEALKYKELALQADPNDTELLKRWPSSSR